MCLRDRTPGVGSEEGRVKEEKDGGGDSDLEEGERVKLREKLVSIEAELEKACQEEDFDRAGTEHCV